jgi:hypothetical protein
MHELSDRVPGQAVIAKLLDVREQDADVSLLGRFFGANPLSAEARPWYRGELENAVTTQKATSTVHRGLALQVLGFDADHGVAIAPRGSGGQLEGLFRSVKDLGLAAR